MKRIFLFITMVALAACAGSGGEAVYEELDETVAFKENSTTLDAPLEMPAAQPVPTDKKIVRTGRMGVRVDDVAEARAGVVALVSARGGYLSRDTYDNAGNELDCELEIRIPSAAFDALMEGIGSELDGRVLYKTIDANDVTEQWVDTETRLANKRAYLVRYREILEGAGTIEEILAVEERIRVLEEEIESAEGRLRYLGDQVALSTLTLTLSQDVPVAPGDRESVSDRIGKSLRFGWLIIVELFFFVIKLWPLVLAGAVVAVVFRWRSVRRKA